MSNPIIAVVGIIALLLFLGGCCTGWAARRGDDRTYAENRLRTLMRQELGNQVPTPTRIESERVPAAPQQVVVNNYFTPPSWNPHSIPGTVLNTQPLEIQ